MFHIIVNIVMWQCVNLNVCHHYRIVEAFEQIASGLTQQENFTELTIEQENVAVRIELVREHVYD